MKHPAEAAGLIEQAFCLWKHLRSSATIRSAAAERCFTRLTPDDQTLTSCQIKLKAAPGSSVQPGVTPGPEVMKQEGLWHVIHLQSANQGWRTERAAGLKMFNELKKRRRRRKELQQKRVNFVLYFLFF